MTRRPVGPPVTRTLRAPKAWTIRHRCGFQPKRASFDSFAAALETVRGWKASRICVDGCWVKTLRP
jgi:hypothetical protein